MKLHGENVTRAIWIKKQSSLNATRKLRSCQELEVVESFISRFIHITYSQYSNIIQVTTLRVIEKGRTVDYQKSLLCRPGRKALARQTKQNQISVRKSRWLLKLVCSFSFPYNFWWLQEKFLSEVKLLSHTHITAAYSMAPFTPQDATQQCSSEHLRDEQGTWLLSSGS